jgi:hypothetical protein
MAYRIRYTDFAFDLFPAPLLSTAASNATASTSETCQNFLLRAVDVVGPMEDVKDDYLRSCRSDTRSSEPVWVLVPQADAGGSLSTILLTLGAELRSTVSDWGKELLVLSQ